MEPRTRPLEIAQLAEEFSDRTRLFCSSWVFSFTGEAIDVDAIGALCREREVYFVLNATQGIGARNIDVQESRLDALVSCGFKWLCGPDATGFCWIHPDLLASLDYHQDYWLAHLEQTDLGDQRRYELGEDLGASRYDVFGTANFFNFAPWTAALELLDEVGIAAVAAHDQRLVDMIHSQLEDNRRLRVLSPQSGPAGSAIVVITHANPQMNAVLHDQLRAAGIDVALRSGNLRLPPHLHNDDGDIGRALDGLGRHA